MKIRFFKQSKMKNGKIMFPKIFGGSGACTGGTGIVWTGHGAIDSGGTGIYRRLCTTAAVYSSSAPMDYEYPCMGYGVSPLDKLGQK